MVSNLLHKPTRQSTMCSNGRATAPRLTATSKQASMRRLVFSCWPLCRDGASEFRKRKEKTLRLYNSVGRKEVINRTNPGRPTRKRTDIRSIRTSTHPRAISVSNREHSKRDAIRMLMTNQYQYAFLKDFRA